MLRLPLVFEAMGGTTGKGPSTGAAGRRRTSGTRLAPRGAITRLVERAPSLFMQGKVDELEQAIARFAPPAHRVDWLAHLLEGDVSTGGGSDRDHRLVSPRVQPISCFRRSAGTLSGMGGAWCRPRLLDGHAINRLEAWLDILEDLRAEQDAFPSPAIEAQVATAMLHALDATLRRTAGAPTSERALEVRIHVLGTFEVITSGQPLRAAGRVAEFLGAIVALGLVGEVTTERLTQALWPDTDGDKQRRVFDTNLYRLRKWLGGDERISLEGGRVSLHARCSVDVRQLLHVLEAIHSGHDAPGHRDRLSPEQGNQRWLALEHDLFNLYRGRLLESHSDWWVVAAREGLHSRFLSGVAVLAQRRERKGQWRDALELYERALRVDDASEPLYFGAMRCHDKMGNRGELARVYKRCCAVLQSTLSVEPSFETRTLYSRVRATVRSA